MEGGSPQPSRTIARVPATFRRHPVRWTLGPLFLDGYPKSFYLIR